MLVVFDNVTICAIVCDMTTIRELLQEAIERDGRSLSELARVSGVDKGQLSRFMRSQRGITVTSADALCAALGVECRLVKQRKGGKR